MCEAITSRSCFDENWGKYPAELCLSAISGVYSRKLTLFVGDSGIMCRCVYTELCSPHGIELRPFLQTTFKTYTFQHG